MITDINAILTKLNLHYTAANLDLIIKSATKQRHGAVEIIEHIAENELQERKKRSCESRLRASKIGDFKPMTDFDWNWPKQIPRNAIEQLFDLSFIDEPSNAIFISASGLGKTMIAKNLAYQAAVSGHTVLFTEAGQMLTDLGSQESAIALKRRIQRYIKPKLLVIDEMGFISYSAAAADHLFEVINRRYEVSATIITTNKAFKDWGETFPGVGCLTAMIDRLTHHAEIISILGDSWRRHEAALRGQKRRTRKSK